MTTEEINKLTWFDLINKLKKFFKSIKDSIASLTNRIVDLENAPPPSQDFIPLSGTTEGNPITNELLMKNTDLASTSVRLFFDGLEWLTETGNELISDMVLIYKDNGGFLIDADYQAEEEGDNLAFGLSGKKDFSENNPTNKLIYAQRSYVEKPETLINALNNCDSTQLDEIKTILGII